MATTWYAQEKDKPGGLLLLQIEKKVKKEFNGVGPHTATIRRYVNANIAGMSPLKIGVKGDVPMCVFKLLCVAVESFVCIQQIKSCQGKITYKKLAASNNEIDMSETYLGWYAAIQKRTVVASVLDFTNEEWESLKRLREADGAERNQVAMANDTDDIIGALGTANKMTGGTIDKGAV
jgi:hypothetical protein